MPKTPHRYRLVIFEAIEEPPAGPRPGLPRDGDAPDRRGAVAGSRTRGPGREPLDESDVRKLLDGLLRRSDRRRGVADRPVPGAEPAADGPSCRLPGRGLPDRRASRRADPLGPLGPDRADLRRADRASRMSIATSSPLAGRRRWSSGIRALALMKPQPSQSPRPRDADSPRSGRRGAHRPPRPADRLPRRREPDELRLPRPAAQPLGRGELPGLSGRSLRAGRRRLSHPFDPLAARACATPSSTNSPVRRPSWTTRPTACSGAGIGAIVTLRIRSLPRDPDEVSDIDSGTLSTLIPMSRDLARDPVCGSSATEGSGILPIRDAVLLNSDPRRWTTGKAHPPSGHILSPRHHRSGHN